MASDFAKSLIEAVQQIDRPGNYCMSGVAPAVPPGLVVDGVGEIGLPLSAQQAKQLKSVCVQAPHGKGQKTVLDTSVRKAWKLASSHFKIENPDWQRALDAIVKEVQHELGLNDQELQAHLYDLLLYEKGGFFLPHKDGERLDQMVATLVIVLPCDYAGGELIVRHEGEEKIIDLAGKDARFATKYAAFYADCEHEIKPLASGHRLCLIYNLTVGKSARPIGAPRHGEHVERIAHLLTDWSRKHGDPQKVAIVLEHEYTEDGLKWTTLKGTDRARVAVLAEAAARSGCNVNLAMLTYWESGSVNDAAYYGRARHGGSWHIHEDGDEADDAEIDELFDSALTAEHWRGPDDVKKSYGVVPLKDDEILPPGAIKKVKPISEIDGYIGNEGLTLDRRYRRAAVVLWPDDRHFDVLVSQGAPAAVPALEEMARSIETKKGKTADAQRERSRKFASSVLNAWPTQENEYRAWYPRKSKTETADPITALNIIDDIELINTYIGRTLARDLSLEPSATLAKIVKRHGIAPFEASLTALFQGKNPASLARNAVLLEAITNASISSKKLPDFAEARRICRPLAESAVRTLLARSNKPTERYVTPDHDATISILASFARVTLILDFDDILGNMVTHVTSLPKVFPLQAVQMKALRAMSEKRSTKSSEAPSLWIDHAKKELEALTKREPQPPSDFARPANIDCPCADCAQLKRFLSDATADQYGFKMAQHRRRHIEESIRRHQCDLDCRTERKSNPQVLVCTKNQATYKRLLSEYYENLKHLETLRTMQATAVSAKRG